jgi:hypothetical protein
MNESGLVLSGWPFLLVTGIEAKVLNEKAPTRANDQGIELTTAMAVHG